MNFLEIPLQPVPNQSLSALIGGQVYAIEIATRRSQLYATVRVNNELVAANRRLVSYAMIKGNLMLVDTEDSECPRWQELGARFKLLHVSENA